MAERTLALVVTANTRRPELRDFDAKEGISA